MLMWRPLRRVSLFLKGLFKQAQDMVGSLQTLCSAYLGISLPRRGLQAVTVTWGLGVDCLGAVCKSNDFSLQVYLSLGKLNDFLFTSLSFPWRPTKTPTNHAQSFN
jgi:hypothetical protein